MSRIFLSHSSANNAEAVALRDWLNREGWDDVFLDVDPDGGIAAGERWERALNEAANRCEAVLFVVSQAWLASDWCIKEFNLAHRLNKRLFGLLVEDLPVADLPVYLSSTWQLVRLSAGRDHVMLRVTMPFTGEESHVTFSAQGFARLKTGLQRAGLDARFFAWPPESDPNRPPYRGLRPLEAEDAGIFFGRDAPIVEALDRLRGLRDAAPPRLLVILGASGAGKSSFLRAGILPRLQRDDGNFLVLPVLRSERAAINGETGLVRSLETAMQTAVSGGAATLLPLLDNLVAKARPPRLATYAYPVIGDLPVATVDTGLVLKVLQPIWFIKPETAGRVRQRMESILDYAKVREWRSGENPARWNGPLEVLLPAQSKVRPLRHFSALPYKDHPAFMAALRDQQGVSAGALEFTILTAARTSETIGARWEEIDTREKVWTVPGARMKVGKDQQARIALSGRASTMDAFPSRVPITVRPTVKPGSERACIPIVCKGVQLRRPVTVRARSLPVPSS
jgi:hypothetical protein